MAKPRVETPSPDEIRALADPAGRLAVRATPGARHDALTIDGGKLLARVRAVAEDGKANAAVLALIARALGCAPSRIGLLRGETAREKLVAIPVLPD